MNGIEKFGLILWSAGALFGEAGASLIAQWLFGIAIVVFLLAWLDD